MGQINPTNGAYILYNQDGMTVTLTFRGANPPPAGFTVVTKDLPDNLPTDKTWLLNYSVLNKGGQPVARVSYKLEGTPRPDNKTWYVYYEGASHAMNGDHTSPGDPPIGYG